MVELSRTEQSPCMPATARNAREALGFKLPDAVSSDNAGQSNNAGGSIDKAQFTKMRMRLFGDSPAQAEAHYEGLKALTDNVTLQNFVSLAGQSSSKGLTLADATAARDSLGFSAPSSPAPSLVKMSDFNACSCGNKTASYEDFQRFTQSMGLNNLDAIRKVFALLSQSRNYFDADDFASAFGANFSRPVFVQRFNALSNRPVAHNAAHQGHHAKPAKVETGNDGKATGFQAPKSHEHHEHSKPVQPKPVEAAPVAMTKTETPAPVMCCS